MLIQDALGMSCTWFRPYGNLIAPSRLILVDVTSGHAASISVVDASHCFPHSAVGCLQKRFFSTNCQCFLTAMVLFLSFRDPIGDSPTYG